MTREGVSPVLGINVDKRIVKCFVCNEGGIKKLAEKWRLSRSSEPLGEIEETYDYTDESGVLLFQVVRLRKLNGEKDFRQRRPGARSGEWTWSLGRTRRVPYRLPALTAADSSTWVHVVEGEKDADRLVAEGLVATTNLGGAGKWRPEYSAYFRGRRVAILRDNDEAGLRRAQHVSRELSPVAAEVRIVELDDVPPKGDVSDWLDAGHTVGELEALSEATAPWLYRFPPTMAPVAEQASPDAMLKVLVPNERYSGIEAYARTTGLRPGQI